jgi:hypothetical protein
VCALAAQQPSAGPGQAGPGRVRRRVTDDRAGELQAVAEQVRKEQIAEPDVDPGLPGSRR